MVDNQDIQSYIYKITSVQEEINWKLKNLQNKIHIDYFLWTINCNSHTYILFHTKIFGRDYMFIILHS